MNKVLFVLFLFVSLAIHAQFSGAGGVYYLGTAGIPINTASYSNPNISGVVVRFKWDDIEHTPNNFNWTFIDGEIAKANTYNKKISLQPLGTPHWLDSIGAQQYNYLDKNSFSPTFGQVLSNVIPWDSIYVLRYKKLLQNLAVKYATDTTVTYINAIGGSFSRGLPDTIITNVSLLTKAPFWTTYNYNADTLANLMSKMTDYYMSLFPITPLWCSVDYVLFQPSATGQTRNYLASLYCNYGITNYPDRFGLFREDISGCNPPPNINQGSHWYIMQQNACRTGAQMLWSVQDGPARMNACGISPNTKAIVLDSAINKGLSFGMRYLEIYGSDIADADLGATIQLANTNLVNKRAECNSTIGIAEISKKNSVVAYPNPAFERISISLQENQLKNNVFQIFNSMGVLWREFQQTGVEPIQVNITELPVGLYFVCLKSNPKQGLKFIKN